MATSLTIAAYLASAWILLSYFLMMRGKPASWLHWANALGCIPLGIYEVVQEAYPPLVVTGVFGVLGWYGIIKDWRD
jgi:hypothetical protein